MLKMPFNILNVIIRTLNYVLNDHNLTGNPIGGILLRNQIFTWETTVALNVLLEARPFPIIKI